MSHRPWPVAAAVGLGLLLSACADGPEVNGKIFDWLGISTSALEQKRAEPKLADRAPLVLPPDSTRLPEPGSGQSAQAALVWPEDPDQRKAQEAKEREKLHLAYCRGDIQWKDRVMNAESVNTPRSPFGPCPSVFGDVSSNVNSLNK